MNDVPSPPLTLPRIFFSVQISPHTNFIDPRCLSEKFNETIIITKHNFFIYRHKMHYLKVRKIKIGLISEVTFG